MKFKDSVGLPRPIINMIERQSTSHSLEGCDISVTELLDPPYVRWLAQTKDDELVVEYSDRLWMLYGSIAHAVAYEYAEDKSMAEIPVVAEVDGWKVIGHPDYIMTGGKLVDYKFGSGFVAKSDPKTDRILLKYEAQMNLYLDLMRNSENPDAREAARHIGAVELYFLIRDWGPRMKYDLPQKVKRVSMRLWSLPEAHTYMQERVRLHKRAQEMWQTKGVTPPPCTDEERWMTDWAVMKEGRKTAIRSGFQTEADAKAWMATNGGDFIRPAEPKRCIDYCDYGKCGICPHFKENP